LRRETKQSERSLPAWRTELSDRVRAIRARKGSEPVSGAKTTEVEPSEAPVKQEAPLNQRERQIAFAEPRPSIDANAAIVEAAIERVRRASETARAAMRQKGTPAAPDRRATARALVPRPEPQSYQRPYEEGEPLSLDLDLQPDGGVPNDPIPQAEALSRSRNSASLYDEGMQPSLYSSPQWPEDIAPSADDAAVASPLEEPPNPVIASVPESPAAKADPLDYLTAEVRKVDEALGREFSRNQPAGLVSRIITDAIDALTIALSFSLFAGSLAAFGADFSNASTVAALAATLVLVSFFYLVTTHCLCGKTFGMMFTNTRLVDAGKLTAPDSRQLFRRVLGYYVAAIPFAAGLLWVVIDKKRRGWQDHLADTLLAADY
jgi:uncharacterized RDD family membrane protein YckC